MGVEPPNSLQAVVFAAMFSGVVSMSEESILMEFGVSKKGLVDNFQMGTETALGRANFIRTAKVETLQAFVMYMVGPPFLSQQLDVNKPHTRQLCCMLSLCIPLICLSMRASITSHYLEVILIVDRYLCAVERCLAHILRYWELPSVSRSVWVCTAMEQSMVLVL